MRRACGGLVVRRGSPPHSVPRLRCGQSGVLGILSGAALAMAGPPTSLSQNLAVGEQTEGEGPIHYGRR
jgi:hypothetical protein